MSEERPAGYAYADAEPSHAHSYLFPAVKRLLAGLPWSDGTRRVFDLGCGNGATAKFLTELGYDVTGVDSSTDGITAANAVYPDLKLYTGSAYDDLVGAYGRFPAVVSLEVVEHLYYPRRFARRLADLIQPGGTALVSTPYHGYFKNLVLAVTGKMDAHFTALWDHGHIKFWSFSTLAKLFEEVGLSVQRFERVGRIPVLAKSMIAVVRKSQ